MAPANRDTAVTGVMPERVRLRDTSMRAIESLPGVTATREAKTAFLRLLARSGVPEIVLAAPARSGHEAVRDDLALVREEQPGCVVYCPFVSAADGVDLARDLGFDGVQVAVPAFGPAAAIYGGSVPASRAEVVGQASEIVAHARTQGLRVAVAATMVSYLTEEELTETVKAMAAAGADEITLFDGPGALGPEAFGHLVHAAASTAPDLEIGIHPHNTFGLGVACAVSAARAGATVVESSVNGYCGGPGNADLAATAAAFEALYGVNTRINLATLTELSRTAAELTGREPATNQPITGPDAFCWGGGDWVVLESEVDPLMHNCVEPSLFGNERRIPVTPQSGPRVIAATLHRLGIEVDPPLLPSITEKCHAELARLGRLLTDDEIRAIARTALTH
ncbi:hypothetical protein E1264_01295 [Actinomadura sp. KC216]|uniref:hypothetical protein n=1 Tax=Actinomadura sp. KC216 TaxID=2530370 RepID=UPI0010513238|nr:hypothetical protein [Actinomadura sp. KC216]TDB91614.1 hypothetical protein E1264_01295 [Actinomadura sp. KC216]